MNVVHELLKGVPLPRMVRDIRQRFPNPLVEDIEAAVERGFDAADAGG